MTLEIRLIARPPKVSTDQTEAAISVESSLAGTDGVSHYVALVLFPRGEPFAAQGALEDAIRHFRTEAEQELAIKP